MFILKICLGLIKQKNFQKEFLSKKILQQMDMLDLLMNIKMKDMNIQI